ncbi:MAG: hypothetical protein KJ622_12795 [Alphaproteobacteria bacterium]|nr:hypothetical protein [Alphaproteobacteria bacterium]
MSDGEFAVEDRTTQAQAGSRLEQWERQTGRVFLSRRELERLATERSHHYIIATHEEYERFQRQNELIAVERHGSYGVMLQAVVAATCIGASAGLSVATTMVVMTPKAPAAVFAFIAQAMTLFA